MVMKCVRKHMVMMMELHILILNDVQANDLASTSFSSSSPPSLFLTPLFLMRPQEQCINELQIISKVVEVLEEYGHFVTVKYSGCLRLVMWECGSHFNPHAGTKKQRFIFKKIVMCLEANCPAKKIWIHINAKARLSSCILKCYEESMK
jgi:hypothetical protein